MNIARPTRTTRTAPLTLRRRILPVIAAAMLALTLIAGLGTPTRVAAQPVGSGVDGVSAACRSLQDQANGLVSQYGDIGRANPNSPQLDVILSQLQQLGLTWRQIGCQSAFGNITGPGIVHAPINDANVGIIFGSGGTQRVATR